jgi:hypothetical protein
MAVIPATQKAEAGDRVSSRSVWAKLADLISKEWLTPVTLAPWEAEIRKIVVQGQHKQIVLKAPSLK